MVGFLLDAHISPEVAEQIQVKRPDIPIHSVIRWEEGRYRHSADRVILIQAARSQLTFVTYDQATIPMEITIAFEENRDLAGVLFVDERSILQDDFGGLVRALIAHWDSHHEEDWSNRIGFLQSSI